MDERNSLRIAQTCATIAELMGIEAPKGADQANPVVMKKAEALYGGEKVERVLMYNPDAIALWVYQKYTEKFAPVIANSDIAIPVLSVMPSVTPVCFASMYTGLMPQEHGIRAYVKPVLRVETLFDSLIQAGKKPIIISTAGDSISEIFKEREMDYIFCDSEDEVNENALHILEEDRYDLITVYNGNFDATMHRYGPESAEALAQLDHNAAAYEKLCKKACEVWKGKRHLEAFLPDHGCHTIDGDLGAHGLDMPEDMNIIHFYSLHKN